MARQRLNLSTEAAVQALEQGEVPWTLHPGCAFGSDPGQWGASLINNMEMMIGCLEAAGARSVVEVGAYAGDVTRFLLDWAQPNGATVWAIDPMPQPELVQLSEQHKELTLLRAPSHEALAGLARADAYVIDGDHNYYTVAEEIRLAVGDGSEPMPLLLFHDIGWPHARRDNYYVPEQIPDEHRQSMVEGGGAFPGHSEPIDGGLPFKWMADHEGGPGNGVLTAVEDFVKGSEKVRFAIIPAFFGFGVVWHEDAPYAARLAEVVAPLDRNPILQRLEANRTFHLASVHFQLTEVAAAHARIERLEAFLTRLAMSRAFRVADVLSRLRVRAGIVPEQHALSRAEVQRVLDEDEE
jgi:hypothetical protein